MTTDSLPADAPEPLLRVVSGNPTADELAALVAVVSALGAGQSAADGAPQGRSAWAHPIRFVRLLHHHGPGQWRANAFPR